MFTTTNLKRIIMFAFGCAAVRILFVYVARSVDQKTLRWLAIPALLVAFAWLYLFFSNKRMIASETFGDAVWWNKLRPVHAALYILFAIMAIWPLKYASWMPKYAWVPLLADVLIAIGATLSMSNMFM